MIDLNTCVAVKFISSEDFYKLFAKVNRIYTVKYAVARIVTVLEMIQLADYICKIFLGEQK